MLFSWQAAVCSFLDFSFNALQESLTCILVANEINVGPLCYYIKKYSYLQALAESFNENYKTDLESYEISNYYCQFHPISYVYRLYRVTMAKKPILYGPVGSSRNSGEGYAFPIETPLHTLQSINQSIIYLPE